MENNNISREELEAPEHVSKSKVVGAVFLVVIIILLSFLISNIVSDEKVLKEDSGIQVSTEDSSIENERDPVIESKILSIIGDEMKSNHEISVKSYSISKTGKYALAALSGWESKVFFLVDLENSKKVVSRIDIDVSGDFSESNHRWVDNDNKLVIASTWSAFGGNGFPGILEIDTKTGEAIRIVDKTDDCQEHSPSYLCMEISRFIIEDGKDGKVLYKDVSVGVEEVAEEEEEEYVSEKTNLETVQECSDFNDCEIVVGDKSFYVLKNDSEINHADIWVSDLEGDRVVLTVETCGDPFTIKKYVDSNYLQIFEPYGRENCINEAFGVMGMKTIDTDDLSLNHITVSKFGEEMTIGTMEASRDDGSYYTTLKLSSNYRKEIWTNPINKNRGDNIILLINYKKVFDFPQSTTYKTASRDENKIDLEFTNFRNIKLGDSTVYFNITNTQDESFNLDFSFDLEKNELTDSEGNILLEGVLGIIKKVYIKDGVRHIDIDRVVQNRDWRPDKIVEGIPSYINDDLEIRTLRVSDDVEVARSGSDGLGPEYYSYEEFVSYFDPEPYNYLSENPWLIEIMSGEVTEIYQTWDMRQ